MIGESNGVWCFREGSQNRADRKLERRKHCFLACDRLKILDPSPKVLYFIIQVQSLNDSNVELEVTIVQNPDEGMYPKI